MLQNGARLNLAVDGTDDEIIGHGGQLPQIHDEDFLGLLFPDQACDLVRQFPALQMTSSQCQMMQPAECMNVHSSGSPPFTG